MCGECGAGWTLPHAPEEELDSYYPTSYPAHGLETGILGVAQGFGQRLILGRALARPPLGEVAKMQPGSLLDVGCGRGDIGAAFVRQGWRVVGVDPSASACAIARARGMEASVGTLGSIRYDDESFDVVVMSHSLEHVPDTPAELDRVHRVLRPGGLLVITVPNFACWQRERFGSAWFPLDLPRHRTHFTPRSLELVLSAAGFCAVSTQPASDNGVAVIASLQYALVGRLFFTHGLGIWATYPIHVLLSPVNRAIDRARGGGALLHAVAHRPGPPNAPTPS